MFSDFFGLRTHGIQSSYVEARQYAVLDPLVCTNIEQVGLSEMFNRICGSKVYFFCAQISVFSGGSNVRNNTPRASRSLERPSNLYIQGKA